MYKTIDYTDLIGKPFAQDGRGPADYDCYGLTKEVYKRFDKEIGEYWCCVEDKEKINTIYRGAVSNGNWREVDYEHGEDIPVPALIGLRFNAPPGIVNHTGVYIGNGMFIHTRERIGVCVDRLDSPIWRRQVVGIYEYMR
nr:MAG TPA: NlpC/P60 family [Caudoviricetes sp.]